MRPTPTTDARPLPQTLGLESVHGAVATQLLERTARWRVRYPALFRFFWDRRTQGRLCVLCDRPGPYLWQRDDRQAIMNVARITAPDSAATRAMVLGGPHALWHQPIERGEIWFSWCARCKAPTTAAGWDAVIECGGGRPHQTCHVDRRTLDAYRLQPRVHRFVS